MNTVKNILDQKGNDVVSVKPEDLLSQALLKLTQHKIGAIMVLNDKGAIKGILSERDIVKHLAGRVDCTTALPVSEVMTKGVTDEIPMSVFYSKYRYFRNTDSFEVRTASLYCTTDRSS